MAAWMSTWSLVLVPAALLGVVTLLGFVGCTLVHAGPRPFSQYSSLTVLREPALVAYWPLSETDDTMSAVDRKGGHNGSYVDRITVRAVLPGTSVYPWVAGSIVDPPNPTEASAGVAETLGFNRVGIVPGDLVPPDFTARTACVELDGAFVHVPPQAALNPDSFTIEAWVRVEWDGTAERAVRCVIDSRDSDTGFALLVNEDNFWEARVGTGGGRMFAAVTGDHTIRFGVTYHVAATYDRASGALALFVDDEQYLTTGVDYVRNTTQPLWIGAGFPFLSRPLAPFKGKIQSVALYNTALRVDVLRRHSLNGNGMFVTPPAFTTYSHMISANSACVAFWPLSEALDTMAAVDHQAGRNHGVYVDPATASTVSPPLPADIYPWPAVPLPEGHLSAAAPGVLLLNQPGIVNGDRIAPDEVDTTPCMFVDGAFVQVPFNPTINPTSSFTFEAWVEAHWTSSDPVASRCVLDARDLGTHTGFGLFVTGDNNPQVSIGTGSASVDSAFTNLDSDVRFGLLTDPHAENAHKYLAVTYDAATRTLHLFVDGVQHASGMTDYAPNTTQPLWIGAGLHSFPRPLVPFKGKIQNVAIYNDALAPDVVMAHFQNGLGNSS